MRNGLLKLNFIVSQLIFHTYNIFSQIVFALLHVTDPPSILYTTEYVVHYVSDFGSSGQLSCVVKTSPDTESHVTWWSSGKELQEGKKYKMSSSAITEGVKLFKLGIEDLQQSDIGSYLCQLSSEYNREESQEAWVQVDYRNGITIKSL